MIQEHSVIVEADSAEGAIDIAEFLPDNRIQDGKNYDDAYEAHEIKEKE